MGWLEPVSTVVTAASLAETLAGSASRVRRFAIRIWNLIRNGRLIIPVFGAGGAGKSTISRLFGGADPLDLALAYDESWAIERVDLPGEIPGNILVSPGQLERIDRSWPSLLREITAGRAPIVFNVVAYGLHSFAVPSFKELDIFDEGDSPSMFMEKFSSARRGVELALLDKLMAGIRHVGHPIQLITIVNKQDLWWGRQLDVRSWYEEGEYGQRIRTFVGEVGPRNIQHEFIPVSSVVANLVTPSNELITPICAGYDQATHLRYLNALFTKVGAVIQETLH